MSAQKKFFTLTVVLILVITFIMIATKQANAYFVISGDDVLAGATAAAGITGGVGAGGTPAATTGGMPAAGNLTPTLIIALVSLVLTGLGGIKLILSSKRQA